MSHLIAIWYHGMVRDIKRKVVKGLVKIKMKLTAHEDFVIGI